MCLGIPEQAEIKGVSFVGSYFPHRMRLGNWQCHGLNIYLAEYRVILQTFKQPALK